MVHAVVQEPDDNSVRVPSVFVQIGAAEAVAAKRARRAMAFTAA